MAGKEFPRLGLYVDQKKLAEVEVRSEEKAAYSVDVPIVDGIHGIHLIFENDFFDPMTKEERNVEITKVSIHNRPAVLIKEPLRTSSHFQYTIDYWTHSVANAYYRDFVEERKRNNEWVHSVATGVALTDDLRRSLVLASADKINFPVHVPASGSLEFGYGFNIYQNEHSARIVVKLHRALHLPVTLFSEDLQNPNQWKQTKIELKRYSGQNIRRRFEAIPSNPGSGPFLIFVSNPTVVSENQATPKLILLISFDALRADHLGIYGYQRVTSPHINAFAAESVLFENASTAATWTLPSFASLFTSMYPSFHNVKQIDEGLSPSVTTFPQLLHRSGYLTAGFIDNPLLHPLYGFAKGFDSYNHHISGMEERVQASVDWLSISKMKKKFLFVHLISPHSPTPPRIRTSAGWPRVIGARSIHWRMTG